jgi:hypothetical protein
LIGFTNVFIVVLPERAFVCCQEEREGTYSLPVQEIKAEDANVLSSELAERY